MKQIGETRTNSSLSHSLALVRHSRSDRGWQCSARAFVALHSTDSSIVMNSLQKERRENECKRSLRDGVGLQVHIQCCALRVVSSFESDLP